MMFNRERIFKSHIHRHIAVMTVSADQQISKQDIDLAN